MRIRVNNLIWPALAVVAVAACGDREATEEGPTIQTAQVTRGDLRIETEATGILEPIRSVEVKSKASGEILRLYVDVGDEVEAGALLAEVDPRDVRNRYDQAEADLAVAQARVEISLAQLKRSEELLAAQVITEQEHETRRLDYANAEAQLVRAQTNFQLAELQLGDVTIRAPMKGTILTKNVEEGQVIQSASGNVSGGTTLFVMANLDEMQVRTLVDETDMGQIEAGLPASVVVEAYPDRTFRGSVEKIEPQAEVQQNVTMFPVIVTLDNRSGLLRPGMNAEVTVLVDEATDVLLVPNNAIVQVSDVGPAAMALGLDLDALDLGQFMRARRGGFAGRSAAGGQGAGGQGAGGSRGAGATGGSAGVGTPDEGPAGGATPDGGSAAAGGAPGPDGAPRGEAAAGPDGAQARRARFDSLRARVERGEISQDSLRSLMQGLRDRAGAFGGSAGAGSFGAPRGGEAGAAGAPARQTRPAVVFVMSDAGVPEPTLVQIGLNDWDNTQVVSGVEEGMTLAVVGAAQLQAQQQAFLERIRSRMGGSPFGGGRGPR